MTDVQVNRSMLSLRDVGIERTKPDEVLDQIGCRNWRLLLSVLLCSFSWALGAFSLMTSAFTTTDCHNCTMTTIVSEFDLRGDREYLAAYSTSLFMVGNMLGGSTLTHAADRYGRRPVMIGCLAVQGIAACAAALAPNYVVFTAFRIVQGAFYTGANLIAWVAAYEHSPTSLRSWTTFLFGFAWVMGYCIVAPIAYFSPSWRILMISAAVPFALFVAACYWFVPETLHFLVSKKNLEGIQMWLDKIERSVLLSTKIESFADSPEQNEESVPKTSFIREILKNKKFIVYCLIQLYLWITDNFIYFGLSLYSTQLAGNMYVNYIMMGLVELPSYVITPIALERWEAMKHVTCGRKVVVAGSHILAGLCFFGTMAVEPGSWLSLWLWLLGKFAISCSFMSLFVYASEMFPTGIRNASIGICSVTSKIGGIMAPFVNLLAVISPNTPVLILGVMSTVAGLLTFILPETHRKPLPSSI